MFEKSLSDFFENYSGFWLTIFSSSERIFEMTSVVGWAKSHFTLLKANETKPNITKKIGCISNERRKLEVSLGI